MLLVGKLARTHRALFTSCRVGELTWAATVPARAAGSPIARCDDPVGG